ncbi:MAG: FHA domain-containing protein [Anaerolineae bacterium]
MVAREHLEIIGPDGTVEFYTVDPVKGVINIGRHRDNDIVIDSPQVALFHAILDHSKKPYTVVVLDEEGETYLNGQSLSPNVSQMLNHWSPLEIDGYTLMLVEGHGASVPSDEGEDVSAPVVLPVPSSPDQPASLDVAPEPAEKLQPPSTPAAVTQRRPVDITDDYIIAELFERTWTVDVEQTVSFVVKLTNGGPIVAVLAVDVEGVDESWVEITPRQIELVPRQNHVVRVSITPPRQSSSRAGVHYPTVVVTSPEHPQRVSQTSTMLTINPYYDFMVGELSPKEQSLGSRDAFGEALIHIANKGNCPANFRIEATDDARGCTYEFVQETNGVKALVPQAELFLPPEETFAVPMRITPKSRPFILRRKRHSFTVTAALAEGPLMPRALLGQVLVRPRIGLGVVLLALLVFVVGTVLMFRPRIDRFTATTEEGKDGILVAIDAGQTVTLEWKASYITALELTTKPEDSEEENFSIDDSSGSKVIHPKGSRVYTLRGETWLFRLLPFLSAVFPTERQVRVDVWKDLPEITVFCLLDESDEWNELSTDELLTELSMLSDEARKQRCPQTKSIFVGEPVIIVWAANVGEVDPEVNLTVNGNPKNLPAGEHQGRIVDRPESPLIYNYTLHVKNYYNIDGIGDALVVTVNEPPTPTPTPLPQPRVVTFDVTPSSITEGEEVTIQWSVENATKVSISGLDQPWYPPVGSAVHLPTKSTDYKLVPITVVESGGGEQSDYSWDELAMVRHVKVLPKPEAPTINYFTARSDETGEVVYVGTTPNIIFTWDVTGSVTDTTDISISGPALGTTISGLEANGSRTMPVPISSASQPIFILTACNGEECATADASLEVTQPPPVIDSFRIANCSEIACARRSGTSTYDVVYNQEIELSWDTHNATQVTLFFGSDNLGGQYPSDVFRVNAVRGGTYRLQAANSAGETVDRYLTVYIIAPELPAPYNFTGPWPPTTPLTLTWNYDADYVEYIAGFRIYRSDGTDEVLVVDLSIDDVEVNMAGDYQWLDPAPPPCGWTYTVVAYYAYPGGDSGETDGSEPYSLVACP